MVAHHVGPGTVTTVVGLDALVVLRMSLVRMGILLLVAIEHGHTLLPTGRTIQPRVVALLMILGVHASSGLARRGAGWRIGGGWWFGNELVQERAQDNTVGN